MDRYTGRDEGLEESRKGPMGNVARLGMGGFVKSNQGMGEEAAQSIGKAEIVVSRREQKQQQMPAPPPPAAPLPAPAASSTSGYQPPAWVGQPPAGLHMCLAVLKEGQVIQEIPLVRPATVFGRAAGADMVLEHQSVSRQHAAVCYHSMTGKWVVIDLGSVHGTWVDGKPVSKVSPAELKVGGHVRFAASTRQYVLATQQHAAPPAQQPAEAPRPTAKRGVQWPDDNTASSSGHDTKRTHVDNGSELRHSGGSGLEQIIGYSDSRDFAVRVGPEPASKDAHGRFADLVTSREEPLPGQSMQPRSAHKRQHRHGSPEEQPRRPAAVQPLGAPGSGSRSGSASGSGFYDWLPPPGGQGSRH